MKYRIAWPNLNCEDCWQQYTDQERRDFPCARCPEERFPPLDRASELYYRLIYYLNACPESLGGYPWEIVLTLAGITDVATLREVWERLAITKRVQDEHEAHQQRKRQETYPNGG